MTSTETILARATDPRFTRPRILVLEADTGRSLLERAADRGEETASVMKTITCAAALHELGPDRRIETRVVRGSAPGEIVIIGGGDVTLSRVPDDGPTYYDSPARMDVLARDTLAALGNEAPTRLVYDDSLFAGGEWLTGQWLDEDRNPEGYIPMISSLQADGDREDPAADDSPRSADPAGNAARAFAAFLGDDIAVVRGSAPANAEELAVAKSHTIEELVRECLRTSDNGLAEALAKLAVIERGEDGTFDGVKRGLTGVLRDLGVPTEGVELQDGSGLSDYIKVPARTIADLIRRARLREGILGMLDDRLSRTGPNGTMYSARFTGENAIVGDAVRGKTGFINSVHSLAGVVRTLDGADLVYAVFAMGEDMSPEHPSRVAIDDFVTSLHLHGDALLTHGETILLDD
ncbi:D-alanyl-D-alanine carboxypeptidase [Leucobacter sp. cx-328]|uniref:D-alanyl-D-alanine carboxypeptidase/D-alanyl-D-alanine-endopeptidase n=1 Tax=unclassified Leucobacter TaxID=2621730 RepID=UPI00165DD61F|nr:MULTISPECIES: D-alanyl-D-alanine carboxypeptidase [unclassified Leucobacter]MBC9944106.1 D-alanyl-D-alanine carboxypeptidase [Leucobacter sp. cx-328]